MSQKLHMWRRKLCLYFGIRDLARIDMSSCREYEYFAPDSNPL